jgi:LacI family transcriptional regulator/LacI family repressor for deo operon, udp, cdd, tsx, nupC, and nupG
MPVTIKDIARAAGVSHTTVSRALKGNPAISTETTVRVQQLAQEMGYTPSAVAQSLLTNRTQTIGVVVTTIADPFVAEVVEGIESIAQTANYSVFLAMSHNNPDQELNVVETLHRRRVDAIIITSSRVGSLYSARLEQIKIPIVLVNNQAAGEYLHSIAADDISGARDAVEHLINLGHRKIGYVGGVNRPRSNKRRLIGYQAALRAAGIEPDPALVKLVDADTDLQRGQSGVNLYLEAGVTALFCYNDVVAIGAIMACRNQRIAVPEQLSVVGFDNIEAATYVSPALTTVSQPRFLMGRRAMEMTLALLDDREAADQSMPCKVVLRESTAKPPS